LRVEVLSEWPAAAAHRCIELIDLHCHLLPQIDDGSRSLAESLEMASLAVADGISVIACTPHILPGLYDNKGPRIRAAIAELQGVLDKQNLKLTLATGADVHIAPDILDGIGSGRILSLSESRYFLLEPPQAIVPPRFEEYIFKLVGAGYVPIITHPERLGWSDIDYGIFERIVRLGAWTQLTGGSLLGQFGRRAQALAERMLEDGLAHILASDAHNTSSRPPLLSEALEAAAEWIGEEEAWHLVSTRPAGILDNIDPRALPQPIRFETMRA
jgi:protein-tyrosine phosphatase